MYIYYYLKQHISVTHTFMAVGTGQQWNWIGGAKVARCAP